jgi:multidrug efflux pump subunit AcrB
MHRAGVKRGDAMDTVTMLGFVVLAGIVVNNAILIVSSSRPATRTAAPQSS